MINVVTNYPLATESNDYISAEHSGTANDNSRNPYFNQKLYQLLPDRKLSVLDLGCAGGGFVKSLIDEGHFAVGLEGCDWCKNRKKFEWATIPDNLLNCDITKPFTVEEDGRPILFDVVTAWEVMEHILVQDLPQLISNIKQHLKHDGLFICSVSEQRDGYYHRTVENYNWWTKLFLCHGMKHHPDILALFDGHMVRGPKKTEWAFEAQQSFHLCLKEV